MERIKKQKGFIAITSVLITGALILVLGVSMFYASLTSQSISSSYDSGEYAFILANVCARQAISKLKQDINYSGDESVDINEMSCAINPIENINDHTKRISTLAKAGGWPHFKKATKEIVYVVESKAEDWICDDCAIENLEILDDTIILSEELVEEIPVQTQGYRISSEINISEQGIIENSQIFWQANVRSNATIIIETRFYNNENWSDWEIATNGKEIPGLGQGTDLEVIFIQTRAAFTGGPEFYPSLKNINIFIEVKNSL